jgi:hypothetical protein
VPDALPARVRRSRLAFRGAAALFLLSLAVQAYLAGAAVMSDTAFWQYHRGFVHVFEGVPLLLLLLAFLGRGTPGLALASFLGWLLIGLQYAFAGMRPSAVAGLHAVNALLLFGLAIALLAARPRADLPGWRRLLPAWKA